MDTRLIAFRCPVVLLRKLDEIAKLTRRSRTDVFIEALQIFTRQVERRKRRVIPPYTPSSMPSYYKNLLKEMKSRDADSSE